MSDEDFDPLSAPASPLSGGATTSTPARRLRASGPAPRPSKPADRPPPIRRATSGSDRVPPFSEEAEKYLISCCLIDGKETIERCLAEGISSDSFYSPVTRILFEVSTDIHKRGQLVTLEILLEELRSKRLLEPAGGIPMILEVSSAIPTTVHAGYFIEKVKELQTLRDFIRTGSNIVEECYGFTGGLREFSEQIETKWADLLHKTHDAGLPAATPITEFNYPATDDPNVLLGADDYLGRGGGMLFVSHGGAGKSSFIMDSAITWGLGDPFVGIRSNGALRTLIIQAEDSARYTGKVIQSYIHKRKLNADQVEIIRKNVFVVRLRGVTGAAFFRVLAQLTAKIMPDLVIINPVYLYAEGDISRPEFAQPFLVGLDAVNRDERFGYILVHHTGKPTQRKNNGQRAELQDWETIYMGFGSSYFANWPRCSALLEPRGDEPGKFWLRLGKAGVNAGVVREVEAGVGVRYEPVTKIALRHSRDTMEVNGRDRPVIFWEPDEEAQKESQAPVEKSDSPKGKRSRGTHGKFKFSELVGVFPLGVKNAAPLARIVKKAKDDLFVPKSTFLEYRIELLESGQVLKNDMGLYYRPMYGEAPLPPAQDVPPDEMKFADESDV